MDVVGLSRRELYISRSGPSGSGTVFFFFWVKKWYCLVWHYYIYRMETVTYSYSYIAANIL